MSFSQVAEMEPWVLDFVLSVCSFGTSTFNAVTGFGFVQSRSSCLTSSPVLLPLHLSLHPPFPSLDYSTFYGLIHFLGYLF